MTDTTAIRDYLEQELARITTELQTIATHDEETDDWVAVPETANAPDADDNTDADIVEDWNERRAIVATLETEYQDIKRALRKISGEPIEADRLAAFPTARTCKAHMADEADLAL